MFTSGLLFSFYVVTYCYVNRWLLFTDEGWRFRQRLHWSMVIITSVMGILLLAEISVDLWAKMSQMDFIDDGHKPKEYADPPWVSIVKCMIANIVALLADIVLIYRVWVVYSRRMWVVWFPVVLWLGGIACTVLQFYLQVVHIHNPDFGPYQWAAIDMNVGPGIVLTPFWSSTVALNVYCTSILIWRIWKSSRNSKGSKSAAKQLQFLIRVLMESGVLYLTISLVHLLVWFGNDRLSVLLLALMESVAQNTAIIPIAFNLILIRVAQNSAEGMGSDYSTPELTTIRFGLDAVSSGNQSSAGTEPAVYDLEDTRLGARSEDPTLSTRTSTENPVISTKHYLGLT